MILSDPSFERSYRGEHHALYFENEMSWVMKIITIISLFLTVYAQYFSKFFCKGPWSAHTNIIYIKICQKLS